jgi:hypothetical protein
MTNAIITIVVIALVGSACVPVLMIFLAEVGLFEPIRISAFGRQYTFAPKAKKALSFSGGTMSVFPNHQTAFAAAVTVVLTIATAGPFQSSALLTGSSGTLTIKDAA